MSIDHPTSTCEHAPKKNDWLTQVIIRTEHSLSGLPISRIASALSMVNKAEPVGPQSRIPQGGQRLNPYSETQ